MKHHLPVNSSASNRTTIHGLWKMLAVACLFMISATTLKAQPVDVLIWRPAVCVDNFGGPACENEGATVFNIVASDCNMIEEVFNSNALNANDLAADLVNNDIDVIVMPETEDCDVNVVFTAAMKNVLAQFIANGGGLIHMNGAGSTQANESVDFFNSTFGWSLSGQGQLFGGDFATLNVAAAAGTGFAGGPATLPNVNSDLTISGPFPNGTKNIYEDLTAPGFNSVFLSRFVNGEVVFIGYDFYTCTDPVSEVEAWEEVLCRTIDEVGPNGFSCDLSEVEAAVSEDESICEGDFTKLAVVGDLGGAANWFWYEGSCGGNLIGIGSVIQVDPLVTTTYYVRGEGGCVLPTGCAQVTVQVVPFTQPQDFNVLGGTQNVTCDNFNTGLVVCLDGSELNFTYELYINEMLTGITAPGTGNPICFPPVFAPGEYRVVAYNNDSPQPPTCFDRMPGIAVLNVVDAPTAFNASINSCPNDFDGNEADFDLTSVDEAVQGGPNGLTVSYYNSLQELEDGINALASPYTSPTGNVWAKVEDGDGCYAISLVQLVVEEDPTIVVSGVNESCADDGDGSATVQVLSGPAPYTYLWSNGENTATISGLDAGTYGVTVSDANGCTMTGSVEILGAEPLDITDITFVNPTCEGENDGSIDITVEGGTNGYTYEWDNGAQDIQDPNGLTAGTYNVSVIDGNECVATAQVTLTDPTAIEIDITDVQNANCLGNEDGSATANASGGTPPYTIAWSNGQEESNVTSLTANFLAAGDHVVTVTDANGCQATQGVAITDPNGLVVNMENVVDVLCNGTLTGKGTAIADLGTPPYEYDFDFNGPGFGDSQYQNALPAGLHKVRVRDANGCIAQTFFLVSEPSELILNLIDLNDETCEDGNDGSITVLAQGGTTPYTYTWLGLGVNDASVDGLEPGMYTVRVQDDNGCVVEMTYEIGAGPDLTIADIPNVDVCPEGQVYDILLNSTPASLATEYSWTGGASVGLTDGSTDGVNPFIPGFIASSTEGSATVTVTATLADGCTDTEEFTINVDDTELAPGFYGCPEDIVVGNDPDACGAFVNWQAPVALDDCGFATVTQTSGPASGSFFAVGTSMNIVYTADDGNGNTATCEFTVTVEDTEFPEISCPFQFLEQTTDAGECSYEVDGTFLNATAADNCDVTSLINDYNNLATLDGAIFQKGAHLIKWTAMDAAGNKMTCSYTLTVSDEEAPTVASCPDDINVDTDPGVCNAVVEYGEPLFQDNCDGDELEGDLTMGLISGSEFPVGVTTVKYIYIDGAGNGPAVCEFTVTVTDNESPQITCPVDIEVNTEGMVVAGSATIVSNGPCGVTLSYTQPIGTDNCASTTSLIGGQGGAPNYYEYGGFYTETYEVVDASGNAAQCSFTITVLDATDPTITCPESFTVHNDHGICGAVVNYANPLGFDNCPGFDITLTEGLPSGSVFPVGETTVEFTISEDAGDDVDCSFTVTVEDKEAPVVECPEDMDVPTSTGILGDCKIVIPDLISNLVASDNCTDAGDLTITQSPMAGSNYNGEHNEQVPVTITVVDEFGNITSCVVIITIIDDEDPVLDCSMVETMFVADPGSCFYTVTDESLNPTIDDNCAQTKRHDFFDAPQLGTLEGAKLPVGKTTITWIGKDAAGNFTTCEVTYMVVDEEQPTFQNCPPDVVINADVDKCGANYNWAAPVVTDNCAVESLEQTAGPLSGSFFPVGTTTITYKAIDVNDNMSTCTFDIEVMDMQLPEIQCPTQFLTQATDEDCQFEVDGDFLDAVGTDNCDVDVVNSVNQTSTLDGEVFELGTYIIVWTGTDGSDNSVSCSYVLTVVDETAPTIDCSGIDETRDADEGFCSFTMQGTGFDPTFDDNCGATIEHNYDAAPESNTLMGATFPVGTTYVTWTATDDAGNTASCTIGIVISDTQDPTIECPADIVVDINGMVTEGEAELISSGPCGVTLSYEEPVGTDNCASVTSLAGGQGGAPNYYQYGGIYTETYLVTDASGNTAECSFTITVEDAVPPTITCPVSFEVETDPGICGAVVNYSFPIDNDNCPGFTTVLSDGLPSGSVFPEGETNVEFTVTDDANNAMTCSFTVTVVDGEAPVILTCGEDQQVSADDNCMAMVPDLSATIEAEDNCTDVDDLIITQDPPAGTLFGGAHLDQQVVVITVEDEEGNQTSCEIVLTLIDDTNPTISCAGIDGDRSADPGACSFTMPGNGFDPVFDDNCLATIMHDYAPAPNNNTLAGATFPVGSTDVVWSATDAAGNTVSCEITINITDDEDPAFLNCPTTMVMIGNDVDQCAGKVNWSIPVALDNCGIESVIQTAGPAPGSNVPVCELQTITYTATDINDNTSTCTFEVLVIDTQKPKLDDDIVMPGDITVECDAIPAPFVLTNNDVNDNCTEPADLDIEFIEEDTQGDDPADCDFYEYTITRTWNVTDEACALGGGSNTYTHVQIIDVEDTTAPMAVCMNITVTLDIFGNATIEPIDIDGGSTDNCADPSVLTRTASQTEFDCDDLGENEVVLTVIDPCGNASTCIAIVTVVEGLAPCTPEYDIDGSDPCVCLDNATALNNGQFGEFIQILSLAGQDWEFIAVNDLYQFSSPNPPALPIQVPVGTLFQIGNTDGVDNDNDGDTDEFDEQRFYTYNGKHVDAQGYVASFQNEFGATITLDNTCFYPTPFFVNLDGPYCVSTEPFEIEVGEVNGAEIEIIDIQINGESNSIFDAEALGSGVHNVKVTVDAGPAAANLFVNGILIGVTEEEAEQDPGCIQMYSENVQVVETPAQVACNDNVQISIEGDCISEITPDMVLEGTYLCFDDYSVELTYPGFTTQFDPPNRVDGSHAGLTLNYTLVHAVSGNVCWGEVTIEDKLDPVVTCPEDVTILCTQDPDNLLITGQPTVFDCSDYTTEYSDVYEQFDCEDNSEVSVIVTRTWIANDEFENSASCVQVITVKRGELSDVVEPADVTYPCNDLPVNFEPETTGWPTVAGIELTDQGSGACGLGVSYDDDIVNTCPGSYKIVRTWTLYDWCPPGGGDPTNMSFVQYIKVEDVAPTITLPTNGYDPVNDWYVVSANGYAAPPHDACVALGPLPVATVNGVCNDVVSVTISTPAGNTTNGGMIPGIGLEEGLHQITYIAEDECGNITNLTITINVLDNIAPIAICDEITDVDLTSDGTAIVFAETFDDGSYDNCCLDDLLVRRMDGDCEGNFDDFDPTVEFCCSDAGTSVMVVFRAVDCNGNTNDCMVSVEVNDKLPPFNLTCPAPVTLTCDEYLEELDAAIQAEDYSLLDQFGTATFYDNCALNIDYNVSVNIDQCASGTITRTWTATDNGNSFPAVCTQTITVNHVSDWVVEFPADIDAVCTDGDLPDFGEPEIFHDECELIGTSFEDTYFYIVPDACYKIERVWTVINWCVYEDYGYDVWEEDGFAECNIFPPFTDWDGDGDNDCRTFRDGWNQSGTPGTPDGYIDYKQIIKVVDNDDPVFSIPEIDGCIVELDCDKALTIPYPMIEDVCSPDFEVDITGDFGIFNDIQGDITIDDVVPGTYDIFYTVTDNCGNIAYDDVTVVVEDCKKPTPYCKNGIIVEIMQTQMVDVWASDLNDNSFDNCPGDLLFSFSPDVNDIGVTYTCDDLGPNEVEIWVTDAAGNQDFCVTNIIIQDNMNFCDGGVPVVSVGGLVETEESEPVEEVVVEVNGGLLIDYTNNIGDYEFGLVAGGDYSITPMLDENPLNGVTTYDLVLITQHILGINALGSPYKMIAADANRSNSITTLDLVEIQKLILTINENFSNNTSWRFVDAAYSFPTPTNPWSQTFPEVVNYNDLVVDQLETNFIAVKIGDVNSTAQTLAANNIDDRTYGNLVFHSEQEVLNAGDVTTIEFTAADQAILGYQFTLNFDPTQVQILGIGQGMAKPENFGFTKLEEGALTASWHDGEGYRFNAEEVVFSIEVEALTDVNLAEAFTVNSRFTLAEAYNLEGDRLDVDLTFGAVHADGFALYQNVPNPFKGTTSIGFHLPEASDVVLQVTDMSGKVIHVIEGAYEAGYNQIDLKGMGAVGVLYYQLSTGTHTATKKMVVVE